MSDLECSERVPFKTGVRRGPGIFGRIRQQEKNEKSFVFLFQFIKVCWGEQEPHFFSSHDFPFILTGNVRAFQRPLNSSVEVSSSITMSPL